MQKAHVSQEQYVFAVKVAMVKKLFAEMSNDVSSLIAQLPAEEDLSDVSSAQAKMITTTEGIVDCLEEFTNNMRDLVAHVKKNIEEGV